MQTKGLGELRLPELRAPGDSSLPSRIKTLNFTGVSFRKRRRLIPAVYGGKNARTTQVDRGWGSVRATKVLRRSSGARSSGDGGFSDRSTRAQWGPSFQAWSNCGARSVHIVVTKPDQTAVFYFYLLLSAGQHKSRASYNARRLAPNCIVQPPLKTPREEMGLKVGTHSELRKRTQLRVHI